MIINTVFIWIFFGTYFRYSHQKMVIFCKLWGIFMIKKDYSAGAVKFAFWFMEFRQMIGLLNEGKSFKEIKELNEKDNIFGISTLARRKQMFSTVSARIKALGKSIYSVFVSCDLTNQKMICLAATMAHDTLFFEFVYEVTALYNFYAAYP